MDLIPIFFAKFNLSSLIANSILPLFINATEDSEKKYRKYSEYIP